MEFANATNVTPSTAASIQVRVIFNTWLTVPSAFFPALSEAPPRLFLFLPIRNLFQKKIVEICGLPIRVAVQSENAIRREGYCQPAREPSAASSEPGLHSFSTLS